MDAELAEIFAAIGYAELAGSAVDLAIAHQEIRILAHSVRDHAALDARQKSARPLVIVAGDHHPVKRDLIHKFDEGILHIVHVAVAVHVLAIDVCDHGEDGRKLQKATVALVGFSDQILRLAHACVGAHGIDAPADNNRRIETACGKHSSDHRSRRRFAVHAGDGNAVLQAHQFGQHLCALDDGDVNVAGGEDLRVVFSYRRAGDDDFRTGDIFHAVAFMNSGAEFGKALGNRAAAQVGARDLESKVEQDFGDAAHADAADSYKMHALDLRKHSGWWSVTGG